MASSPSSDAAPLRPSSWCGGHMPAAVSPSGSLASGGGGTEETDAFQFMIAGSLAQARSRPRQPALVMKSSQIAQFDRDRQHKSLDLGQTVPHMVSPPSADLFTKPWLFAVQPTSSNSTALDGVDRPDRFLSSAAAASSSGIGDKTASAVSLHRGASLDASTGPGCGFYSRPSSLSGTATAATAIAEHGEKMLQLHHSYSGAQLRSPLYGHVGSASLSLSDGWRTPPGRSPADAAAVGAEALLGAAASCHNGGCGDDGSNESVPMGGLCVVNDRMSPYGVAMRAEGSSRGSSATASPLTTSSAAGWCSPVQQLATAASNAVAGCSPQPTARATDPTAAVAASGFCWQQQQQQTPVRSPDAESPIGRQQPCLPASPVATAAAGHRWQAVRRDRLSGSSPPVPAVQAGAEAASSSESLVASCRTSSSCSSSSNSSREQQQQQQTDGSLLQSVSESHVVHVARLVRIGSDGSLNDGAGSSDDHANGANEPCPGFVVASQPLPSGTSLLPTAGCRVLSRKLSKGDNGSEYENIAVASSIAMLVTVQYPDVVDGVEDKHKSVNPGSSSSVSRRFHKRTMSDGASIIHNRQGKQLHRSVTEHEADVVIPPDAHRTTVPISCCATSTPGICSDGRPVAVARGTDASTSSPPVPVVKPVCARRPSVEGAMSAVQRQFALGVSTTAPRCEEANETLKLQTKRPVTVESAPSARASIRRNDDEPLASDNLTSEDNLTVQQPQHSDRAPSRHRRTFSESGKRPSSASRATNTKCCEVGQLSELSSRSDFPADSASALPETSCTRVPKKLPVAEVSPFTMTSCTMSSQAASEQSHGSAEGTEAAATAAGTQPAVSAAAAASRSSEAVESSSRRSNSVIFSGITVSAPIPYSNAQARSSLADGYAHERLRSLRKNGLQPPSGDDGSGGGGGDDAPPARGHIRDCESVPSSSSRDCDGSYENVFDRQVATELTPDSGLSDSTYRGQLRRASEYQFRRSSGPSTASLAMSSSSIAAPSAGAALAGAALAAAAPSLPAEVKLESPALSSGDATKPQPKPRFDVELRPVPPPKPAKSIYRYCSSSNLMRLNSQSAQEDGQPNSNKAALVSRRSFIDDAPLPDRSENGFADLATSNRLTEESAPPPPAAASVPSASASAESSPPAPTTTRRVREPVPTPRLSIVASHAAPPLPERRAHVKMAEISFPPPPAESPQDEVVPAVAAATRCDKRSSFVMTTVAAEHTRSGSFNSADREVATVLMTSGGGLLSTGGPSAFKPITSDIGSSSGKSSPSASSCGSGGRRASSDARVSDLSQSTSPDSAAMSALPPRASYSFAASSLVRKEPEAIPSRLKSKWPSPQPVPIVTTGAAAVSSNVSAASPAAAGGRTMVHETAAEDKYDSGHQEDLHVVMTVLRQQIECLHLDRKQCEADASANNAVGAELVVVVSERCGDRQAAKYSSFVDDIEKVTRLLLRLERRLAKAESEAAAAESGAAVRPGTSLSSPAEMRIAETKREQLQRQHDDARMLRDGIERQRTNLEETVLRPVLDASQLECHVDFVTTKLRLISELAEIDDKISSYEERLAVLARGDDAALFCLKALSSSSSPSPSL